MGLLDTLLGSRNAGGGYSGGLLSIPGQLAGGLLGSVITPVQRGLWGTSSQDIAAQRKQLFEQAQQEDAMRRQLLQMQLAAAQQGQAQNAQDAVTGQKFGAILGGMNPGNVDAAAYNQQNAGDPLQMVQTQARRMTVDPMAFRGLAATDSGARYVNSNPMLQALTKPQTHKEGDTIIDPLTGASQTIPKTLDPSTIYSNDQQWQRLKYTQQQENARANASQAAQDRRVGLGGDPAVDANIETMANLVANYQMKPPSTSFRNPMNAAVLRRAAEINPNFDATQFDAKKSAITKFTSGKQGDTIRSFNVAVDHLDQLGQLAKALGNNDIQGANMIANAVSQTFGSPVVPNFNAVKQIVADEVVKAVVGSGGALGDREEIAKQINAASSPKQLAGVIDNFKGLMAGQLHGLSRQYEQATGLKNFDSFLSDATKAHIEARHGAGNAVGGGAGRQGGGAPAPGTVSKGYRFKGGNPSDPNSWEKI